MTVTSPNAPLKSSLKKVKKTYSKPELRSNIEPLHKRCVSFSDTLNISCNGELKSAQLEYDDDNFELLIANDTSDSTQPRKLKKKLSIKSLPILSNYHNEDKKLRRKEQYLRSAHLHREVLKVEVARVRKERMQKLNRRLGFPEHEKALPLVLRTKQKFSQNGQNQLSLQYERTVVPCEFSWKENNNINNDCDGDVENDGGKGNKEAVNNNINNCKETNQLINNNNDDKVKMDDKNNNTNNNDKIYSSGSFEQLWLEQLGHDIFCCYETIKHEAIINEAKIFFHCKKILHQDDRSITMQLDCLTLKQVIKIFHHGYNFADQSEFETREAIIRFSNPQIKNHWFHILFPKSIAPTEHQEKETRDNKSSNFEQLQTAIEAN